MMIDQMIMEARSMGCSDIHITVGMPLMYRINGRLPECTDQSKRRRNHRDARRAFDR